jgi:putative ABC transport system permease protein
MVESATSSTTIPGNKYSHEVNFSVKEKKDKSLFYVNDIELNFFTAYDVKFLAGTAFSNDTYWKNKKSIILNRTAALALGFDNFEKAIDEKITNHENNAVYNIIGIVDDYHQASLKETIRPQAFLFNQNRGDISVKINANSYSRMEDIQRCISSLNEIWNKIYKDQSFEYFFLDAKFNAQYHDDIKFRKIFQGFTGLSIFIACLGLFGLSLFISVKRKKEIGIRKVFGASSWTILILFVKDYLLQILISILVGAPIAFFLMKNWLTGYSFRTSINWESLAFPCLWLIIISLLTTGFQTIKTALLNPTKTLRED